MIMMSTDKIKSYFIINFMMNNIKSYLILSNLRYQRSITLPE